MAKTANDILPEKFDYKTISFKFHGPENFECDILIKGVENESQFKVWFDAFKQKSQSDWIVQRGQPAPPKNIKHAKFAYRK